MKGTLLVLGLAGQYPLAGVAWEALHYLVGFRRLGWDVYYIEDSGAWPWDPRPGASSADCSYAVGYLDGLMRRFGFGERWAYVELAAGRSYGLARARLDALYGEAEAIVNLCGATDPREEHRRGARLIYIDTDPGRLQIAAASGDAGALRHLANHDVLFTYGANLGAPDCPVPLGGLVWHATRPPVVLDFWTARCDPSAAAFTTVTSWETKGAASSAVAFGGEVYLWSKHVSFLRLRDLARLTPQPLRLAVHADRPEAVEPMREAGFSVMDALPISLDPETYREFIHASRGEVTPAKDIYVRLRTGWFSERSACYLAAGKPVVTEETSFSKLIPTGEGLFAFTTSEEAAEAIARVNADYARHCAAARRVAEEHFRAEAVLARVLERAGLG